MLRQVQSAKFARWTQHRVKAADAALSLAEDLGVRVDRDRLLWLVGPASARHAKWEAETIAQFERGEAWQLFDPESDQEAADGADDADATSAPKPR